MGYTIDIIKNSFIATQNHATTAWRPVLIITEAVAGGDNDTTLPVGTLTLTGNVPTAVTTNKNLTTLPNGALTLTGHASIATVTQKNVSALPLGTLALSGNNPSAANTNKHISALPSIALGLTGHTPTAATTQRHVSTIPAAMLTLTRHAPGAVVTQKHIPALPVGILTLTGYAPISIYAEDIDNLLEIIRSTDEIEPLAASEYNQIIHGEALPQFESVEILALTGTKQTTTRSAKPTTSIRASRRNFNIH